MNDNVKGIKSVFLSHLFKKTKEMTHLQNYIDGSLVAPIDGAYIDNIDPSRGKVYSLIPDSDKVDVDKAVAAAEKAFPQWSNTPVDERSAIMVRIANLIESRMDEFAAAESLDNGKPVSLASHVDIPRAVSNFRFFATAILHFASE